MPIIICAYNHMEGGEGKAMCQLSVVVPTYNESKNIHVLYERADAALSGIKYELIFIDDSVDDTPQVIEALCKKHDNVMLKHRTAEKGLATAVLCGFSIAKGEYIAVMDADLQHPPEILRAMYAVVSAGYDFCIPSRFIPGGGDGGLNAWRKFVSWTARYMGKLLLSSLRKVSDPTSGLFMFRREAIAGSDLQPIGWKIMVEVLAMSDFSAICEIPYVFCERNAGESKLDSRVTIEYIKQLFGLMGRQKKKKIEVRRFTQDETDEYIARLEKSV